MKNLKLIEYSTTICKLVDLIPAVHQSDCWISIGSVPKPCIVPAPTTAKLPHASGHSSGNHQGHVTKTKTHRFEIFVELRFINGYFFLDSWHHLYIFPKYHLSHGVSSLANYMAKQIWEWKPRLAVALVVRGLLIVTSHTNCDVTSFPVVHRYVNADWDEQRYKRRTRKFILLFIKLWSWQNRHWPLIWFALSWLVLLSGRGLVVLAVGRKRPRDGQHNECCAG